MLVRMFSGLELASVLGGAIVVGLLVCQSRFWYSAHCWCIVYTVYGPKGVDEENNRDENVISTNMMCLFLFIFLLQGSTNMLWTETLPSRASLFCRILKTQE